MSMSDDIGGSFSTTPATRNLIYRCDMSFACVTALGRSKATRNSLFESTVPGSMTSSVSGSDGSSSAITPDGCTALRICGRSPANRKGGEYTSTEFQEGGGGSQAPGHSGSVPPIATILPSASVSADEW